MTKKPSKMDDTSSFFPSPDQGVLPFRNGVVPVNDNPVPPVSGNDRPVAGPMHEDDQSPPVPAEGMIIDLYEEDGEWH